MKQELHNWYLLKLDNEGSLILLFNLYILEIFYNQKIKCKMPGKQQIQVRKEDEKV